MGSKLSKRRHEIKLAKPKKEKMPKQRNNPGKALSTQSLNLEHSVVSSIPHPNVYETPESAKPLPKHQSLEDLTVQAPPSVQQVRTRTLPPPPVPRPTEIHRLNDSKEKEDNDKVNEEKETTFDDYLPVPCVNPSPWKPSMAPPPKGFTRITTQNITNLPKTHGEHDNPTASPQKDENDNLSGEESDDYYIIKKEVTDLWEKLRSLESKKDENDNLSGEESDIYDSIKKEVTDLWEKLRSLESKKKQIGKVNEKKETKTNHSTESDSKPKVDEDEIYKSTYETDTSLKKTEIPQLITDGEIKGWYFVRNVETGEESYVHKDWVAMTTSNDVQSKAYFFNEFDRKIAEVKLLERGIEIGTYLLRPSSEDGYALSLRCANGSRLPKIRHYKVRVSDKGLFYIDSDTSNNTFSNIVELIRYYSKNPGLHSKLKKPLPRDIQLNDLACKVSDLKLGKILGTGNFGSVYAGTLHNNKEVAVKLLKDGGSMTVKEFRQEAKTMHTLRHPNLVSLLAICEDSGRIFIITERMSKGALLTLLRIDTGKTIKFKDLMDMAIQVAEGMCYLEKKTFVHRDLRAANILVGDGNIAKIADFGLTRLLDRYYDNEVFYKGKQGSLLPYKWTAPEGLIQLKFTVKSDVWSFGILLYEMVTYGGDPYPAMPGHVALDWIEKGNRLKRPTEQYCPLALYNIMKQCWLKNSDERPNFEYIKENLVEIKTKG